MGEKEQTKEQCEVFDKGALEGAFVKAPVLVMFDSRLTHSQFYTYMLLKSFAWRGSCFPGKDTLSSQGGISVSSVYRNIETLETFGLITVERNPGRVNRYVLELMADVYYESIDPPRLKPDYVKELRERGLIRVVERALDIEIGEESAQGNGDAKNVMVRKVSDRTQKILGSFKSAEEKAQEARDRAAHNRKVRKKHDVKAERPADVDDAVAAEEKPINAADVEAIWRTVAAELWPNSSGMRAKWGGENMGIAKRLVDKWGGAVVVHCVEIILKNWGDFQARYRVNRPLNMKLIAYFADSWFPEIQEGKKMSLPSRREKALRQGEYDKDGTATRQGLAESWLDR